MAGPKEIETRIRTTISALESLAPTKSFGGMTLDQFKTGVAPSLAARETIANLENQLVQAKNQRDTADEVSLAKVQVVVLSVLADPTEGPDSSLIEALGRVRQSERKTGLTRKKTKAAGGGSGGSQPTP